MALLWGEGVSQQNISDALRKLGLSRKSGKSGVQLCLAHYFSREKTQGYQERDQQQRQACRDRLKTKTVEQLVYVDEAGIDNREDYPDGYCEIGQRFYALKSGKRTERVNGQRCFQARATVCPMTFVGSCNRDLFETWLIGCLLPRSLEKQCAKQSYTALFPLSAWGCNRD